MQGEYTGTVNLLIIAFGRVHFLLKSHFLRQFLPKGCLDGWFVL